MAKKAKSSDVVRVAKAARVAGAAVAREVGRSRMAASSGQRWRADQVQRHKAAVRQVRRHQKRIQRADRALAQSLVIAGVGGAVVVAAAVSGWGPLVIAIAMIATVLAAVRSVYWRSERQRVRALPPPPPPPPLPPPGLRVSETWPFVARLDRAVRSWEQLEPLLLSLGSSPSSVGPSLGRPYGRWRGPAAGDPSYEDPVYEQVLAARHAAYLARDEINARIAAIQSLEVAAATAPPVASEHLRAGVSGGLADLASALDSYEAFIAAASAAVVAGGRMDERFPDSQRSPAPFYGRLGVVGHLQEATDVLAGLAEGLRELRYRTPGYGQPA